jgi:hypothetical protein
VTPNAVSLIFENTGLIRHRRRTTVNHSQISEVSSVKDLAGTRRRCPVECTHHPTPPFLLLRGDQSDKGFYLLTRHVQ